MFQNVSEQSKQNGPFEQIRAVIKEILDDNGVFR